VRRYSRVEPLSSIHRRQDFRCGSAAITEWFRRHALTAHRADTSKVYVVRRWRDDLVVGFYALSGGSVNRADATARMLKGARQYPSVPVVVLTRLAVDLTEERRGLGRALLRDAFTKVLQAAEIVGVRALLIHAEDEQAVDFYMKIASFDRSPTDDVHLILLIKDLRVSVSAEGDLVPPSG
jgi:GNAT superfamily N-acetyltransferase